MENYNIPSLKCLGDGNEITLEMERSSNDGSQSSKGIENFKILLDKTVVGSEKIVKELELLFNEEQKFINEHVVDITSLIMQFCVKNESTIEDWHMLLREERASDKLYATILSSLSGVKSNDTPSLEKLLREFKEFHQRADENIMTRENMLKESQEKKHNEWLKYLMIQSNNPNTREISYWLEKEMILSLKEKYHINFYDKDTLFSILKKIINYEKLKTLKDAYGETSTAKVLVADFLNTQELQILQELYDGANMSFGEALTFAEVHTGLLASAVSMIQRKGIGRSSGNIDLSPGTKATLKQ